MMTLAVETSCDETAAAVYDSDQGLLAHALHSQVEIHRIYGGVVPELASRDHIIKLLPLVRHCVQQAGVSLEALDALAYTAGPGLIGALLVGASFTRALAWALDKPVLPVHHMEGHLLSPLMETPAPDFPFVALLVSGGHTMLVHVEGVGRYSVMGDTLDDAVGEAFDKTAKLLGLPYPGGPAVAALAARGEAGRFHFPRPMLNKPNCNFSFSGLKTHVIHAYRKLETVDEQTKADMCKAFEEAVAETLLQKSLRALQMSGCRRLVVSGGVSANTTLRQQCRTLAGVHDFEAYFPSPAFSTDNAAMIAFTADQRLTRGQIPPSWSDGDGVRARWPLEDLQAP